LLALLDESSFVLRGIYLSLAVQKWFAGLESRFAFFAVVMPAQLQLVGIVMPGIALVVDLSSVAALQ